MSEKFESKIFEILTSKTYTLTSQLWLYVSQLLRYSEI